MRYWSFSPKLWLPWDRWLFQLSGLLGLERSGEDDSKIESIGVSDRRALFWSLSVPRLKSSCVRDLSRSGLAFDHWESSPTVACANQLYFFHKTYRNYIFRFPQLRDLSFVLSKVRWSVFIPRVIPNQLSRPYPVRSSRDGRTIQDLGGFEMWRSLGLEGRLSWACRSFLGMWIYRWDDTSSPNRNDYDMFWLNLKPKETMAAIMSKVQAIYRKTKYMSSLLFHFWSRQETNYQEPICRDARSFRKRPCRTACPD